MATVTVFTAERMAEIEGASIIDGMIAGSDLILVKHNGEQINAGAVVGPKGDKGDTGPMGFYIPGQLLMWANTVLPDEGTYGKWVWADGAAYLEADYPIAAGNINIAWKTFAGAAAPPAGQFRVPDLRGLVPAGLDQMPGGSRANRMTRSVAITIAAKTGEETHVITIPEMPAHTHTYLRARNPSGIDAQGGQGGVQPFNTNDSINTGSQGSGTAHENVQPTVFIPYLVKLDD